MEFKFTPGEKNTYMMEVEIPYEEMELPIKKTVKEYAQKVNIPGFRKGKVPAQVVESFIGVQAILSEAAENMIADRFMVEIAAQDFEPIAAPRLEVVQAEKGKTVIMKGSFPVQPPVKLGKYMGVEVTKRVYKVGDADIDQEIHNNLTRVAKLADAPYDTVTANGHIVYIDFKGELDGELFEGGSADDYPLELGSGSFIPGFEEQLIGLRLGDSKDVVVTFPKGYAEPKLAGKEALFHCRVNNIRVRELPELNDDLVKDLSETADTVAQYREELRVQLQEEADKNTEEQLQNAIITEAAKDVEVEIPMTMTEPRVNQMFEDLQKRLDEQELDIQDYLSYMKTDIFSIRKEFRKQAEEDAKIELMLQAIAKKEKITFTQEEVDAEIKALAEYNMMEFESYKKQLMSNDQMHYIFDKITLEKTSKFVLDNAVVSVEEFDAAKVQKLMAEQAAAAAANKPSVVEKSEEAPKRTRKAAKKEAPAEEAAEEAPKKTRKSTKKSEEN